ncbi:hypothetical protein N8642_03305 [bacterium]|nr:hypothetical protein [bacterium]
METWKLSVRFRKNNPNHHLFNNHGGWAIADSVRQHRFRVNLHTRSATQARALRDQVLESGWRQIVEGANKGGAHV